MKGVFLHYLLLLTICLWTRAWKCDIEASTIYVHVCGVYKTTGAVASHRPCTMIQLVVHGIGFSIPFVLTYSTCEQFYINICEKEEREQLI